MDLYYDELKNLVPVLESEMKARPTLAGIFNHSYFESVMAQLLVMEKNGWVGPISSMFIFMNRDKVDSTGQLDLFEKYLSLIFNHPATSRADKNHIISELQGSSSTDVLFEVNVLGNLLNQVDPGKIDLFPNTVGRKDVEAKVLLDQRWVYIEVTNLNDTAAEVENIDQVLNHGAKQSGEWLDLTTGQIRYQRKLESKVDQFIPKQPNALVLAHYGTQPTLASLKGSLGGFNLANIGVVLEFNRRELKKVESLNCDPDCALSSKELDLLVGFLSGSNYKALAYGTT